MLVELIEQVLLPADALMIDECEVKLEQCGRGSHPERTGLLPSANTTERANYFSGHHGHL
jgi:hypothetical protein